MVSINYSDFINLNSDKINPTVETAFGNNSLGLLIITEIPDILTKRENILSSIKKFAEMPESIKNKYVDPKSLYSFGWSHGKEKLSSGVPDLAKGSFYANPVKDISTTDTELKKKSPEIYSNNIWPDELPELKESFFDISKLLVEIGLLFCKHLDQYLTKKTNKKHSSELFNIISQSDTYKGRMLHYFPTNSDKIDGLCGWHLDHGCITLLISPLYYNLSGNIVDAPKDCGLYVKSKNDENIKIEIPENAIAIQLGEMFQFLSGGFLRATPHCVKSGASDNISREQLALFMDCSPNLPLKLPVYTKEIDDVLCCKNLPDGVPTLKSRILGTKTYQEFVINTLQAYYN